MNGYQAGFAYDFIPSIHILSLENHEFTDEFKKKHMNSGVPEGFACEFMFMNSYMNLYSYI